MQHGWWSWTGIWGSGVRRESLPEADEQRCWNHKVLNVLEQLPRYQHAAAKARLREIVYASIRAEAERKQKEFKAWCRQHAYAKAVATLRRNWERTVTLYHYPKECWVHLRTTNVVESPFAALRLRTDAAKRYKKVERATAEIWKMPMVAEKRFGG